MRRDLQPIPPAWRTTGLPQTFPSRRASASASPVVIFGAGGGAAAGSAGLVGITANSDSSSPAEVGVSSAGEEDRAVMSTSTSTTCSLSTSIVRSAPACRVCNKFDDSSWVVRAVKDRRSSSMTSACGCGGGEVEARWGRR